MDPQDRLFGEIAIQLQLLSREQVARCVAVQREHRPSERIGSVALELGYISDGEVQLVLAQQQRVLEKRRQTGGHKVPAIVDEQSGGAAPQEPAPAPRRRAPRNDWAPAEPAAAPAAPIPAAESRPGHTSMELGHTVMAVAAPPAANPPAQPAATGAAFAGTMMQPSGALGQRPPAAQVNQRWGAAAAPTPEPSEELEAFPIAEGEDRIDVGLSHPPTQGGAAPIPGAASATMLQRFSPAAQPQPAAPAAQPRPPAPNAQPQPAMPAAQPAMPAAQPAAMPAAQPAAAPAVALAGSELVEKSPRAKLPKPAAMPASLLGTYLGKALQHAIKLGASDLHVHSGSPLLVRVDGKLQALGGGSMTANAAEKVIAEIMSEHQWALLADRGELDFALDLGGIARLRTNVFRQQRGLDIVFRIIPPLPPTLEGLGLPSKLARLCDYRTGLVLCTGPTGCGKSSTLAALVNLLVQSRPDHILTIEDPIEYTYPPSKALVNQREVGGHTSSFARALRAALREDPDIIAITELRDRETISLAMSAAETGHLVLGTLHTGNAGQTINRIISVFPAEEQDQVRVMLAESLRAVLSQRLVPLAAGRGRIPAIELMMVNTAVSNIIREDKSHQLPSVMQTGKAAGMITLDDSLAELVASGKIAKEDAQRHAVKKERFR